MSDETCVGVRVQRCKGEAVVIVAGVGAMCSKHARFIEAHDRRAGEPYEARPIRPREEGKQQ